LRSSTALVADTPIEQIRAYLRWHLLHAYADTSLPESFDHENWNFYSHIF
jgi:putative endopeptidase